MSEKLPSSAEPEKEAGNHRSSLEINRDRFLQILADMEQPLHYRDIQLLVADDGYGEIDTRIANLISIDLVLNGKAVRIGHGIYSLPEFAGKDYDLSESAILERDIKRTLEQAGRPLLFQDLVAALTPEVDDNPSSGNANRIANRLDIMLGRGEIVRPEYGAYSLPQFEHEPLPPPSVITTPGRLQAIMEQAARPVSRQEISSGMQADGHEELKPSSVSSSLERMIITGKAVRTAMGYYSLPEFADNTYEPLTISVGERCLAALWQAGRALHHRDIYHLVEADGHYSIAAGTIKTALSRLIRENLVARVDRGIYTLPEFSLVSDREHRAYVNKSEITSKVVEALGLLGGSALTHHLYTALAAGNLKILSQEQVTRLLKRMSGDDETDRKIVRTGKDSYCLPELADGEYEEIKPQLKPRSLAVLKQAAKPLHLVDICDLIEGDGHGPVKLKSVEGALDWLVYSEDVIKVMRGVYALPEFGKEQYELPKPSTDLRAELALAEAARPLHVTELLRLVNDDDQKDVRLDNLSPVLSKMTIKKRVVRVATSVYALPEFAGKEYKLPKRTWDDRLNQILSQAARPLYLREIVQQLEADNGSRESAGRSTAGKRLSQLVSRGEVVKVSHGIYALPEFAGKEHELPG